MRIRNEQPGFALRVQEQYRRKVEDLHVAAPLHASELQILETPTDIRTIVQSGILPMRELRRQYAEQLRANAQALDEARQELDML